MSSRAGRSGGLKEAALGAPSASLSFLSFSLSLSLSFSLSWLALED
jgi:hypothetical protein